MPLARSPLPQTMVSLYRRHPFALSLVTSIGLILGAAAFAVLDLRSAIRQVWDTHAELLAGLDRIAELQFGIQEARRSMLYSLTTNDANLQIQYAQASQDADRRVDQLLEEHLQASTSADALALGRKCRTDWHEYLKMRDDIVASILEGNSKLAVERDLVDGAPAFNNVRNDLQSIHEQYKRQADGQMALAQSRFNKSLSKLGVVLALILLLAGFSAKQFQKGQMLGVVQSSELRMRQVIESISEGMFVVGSDGCIELWNRAAEQISKLARDAVLGSTIFEVFPKSVYEPLSRGIRDSIGAGNTLMLGEIEMDGEREARYWEARLFPMGEGATVFFTDISERKRAEEQSRSSVKMLEDLKRALDQHCIVAMTDHRGIITFANGKFCSISKYGMEELVGQDHRILNSKHHSKEFIRNLWTTIKGGQPWKGEIKNRAKDGTEYWVDTTIVPFKDSGGEIQQYIAIRTDITPLKKAEEESRNAREVAEAASRAKSDFLANMSHEIRTPMNGIIGISDLLAQTKLDAEQRDYVDLVSTSAQGLLAVLNDILDFSKIESGKLDFSPAPVAIRKSLLNILKVFAAQASKKNIELTLQVADEVPETVIADELRVRQVLNNLIGNALKFTAAGEIAVRVDREKPSEDRIDLHFQVRDTGVGIPPDKLKLIFEPFSQADSSITRKYGGTGLGLTISGRLVQMMGGRIWVESEPGKGSTFHFIASFNPNSAADVPAAPADPASLRTKNALIVDDNATNRLILEKMLARWGIHTASAPSAAEGLMQLRSASQQGEPFSLLIVDGQMPEMDGFTMVRQLREQTDFDALAIVMLTSAGALGDGERCRELGIRTFLSKPVDSEMLHEAILRALGQPSDGPIPVKAEPEPAKKAGGIYKILLAEDNPVNQVVATRHLEKLGHSIQVASNGRQAVNLWEQGQFDLILMDVQMPEMSGYEATSEIRKREAATHRHTVIIAMTAHAMVGDREKCLAAGMDGYVSKPIQIDALSEEISRLSREAPTAAVPLDPPVTVATLNRPQLITLMDGDLDLLMTSIEISRTEIPKLLSKLHASVDSRDAGGLEQAAHALKGMLRGLAGERSAEIAQRLEEMGKAAKMENSPSVLEELEAEMTRFDRDVRKLIEDVRVTNSFESLV